MTSKNLTEKELCANDHVQNSCMSQKPRLEMEKACLYDFDSEQKQKVLTFLLLSSFTHVNGIETTLGEQLSVRLSRL